MRKALLPAICGLFVSILSASAIPLLTLTEESSTLLTWSWSAGFAGSGALPLVDPLVPDNWAGQVIGFPTAGPNIAFFIRWAEDATTENLVVGNLGGADPVWDFEVQSDLPGQGGLANGAIVFMGDFEMRFIDNGDQPGNHVPDSGGMFSMMFISLAGLGLYRRYTSRCSLQRG